MISYAVVVEVDRHGRAENEKTKRREPREPVESHTYVLHKGEKAMCSLQIIIIINRWMDGYGRTDSWCGGWFAPMLPFGEMLFEK